MESISKWWDWDWGVVIKGWQKSLTMQWAWELRRFDILCCQRDVSMQKETSVINITELVWFMEMVSTKTKSKTGKVKAETFSAFPSSSSSLGGREDGTTTRTIHCPIFLKVFLPGRSDSTLLLICKFLNNCWNLVAHYLQISANWLVMWQDFCRSLFPTQFGDIFIVRRLHMQSHIMPATLPIHYLHIIPFTTLLWSMGFTWVTLHYIMLRCIIVLLE